MPDFNGFVYKTPRNAKGLTQEKAAELLNLSLSSLQAYEAGERLPSNQTVAAMADLYDAPHMGLQHLRQDCLGQEILPDIHVKDVAGAVLQLLDVMQNFEEFHKAIIRIASDNVISDDEMEEWAEIIVYLKKLGRISMEVQYAKMERE